MHVIKRPNGEPILNDIGELMKFKNDKSARIFLQDNGVRKPEKEGFTIVPYNPALEPNASLAN